MDFIDKLGTYIFNYNSIWLNEYTRKKESRSAYVNYNRNWIPIGMWGNVKMMLPELPLF